ncbi:MAG: hypothetical protein PHC70_01525 [Patescibacteria group bacterium]|nr:hypothetical protein [Patescibacteria group bacterium]
MENPFLIQKYPDLPGSKPVESAVKKARQSGEKIRNNPEERVEAYLDRLEKLVMDPGREQESKQFAGQSRPRALSLLREMLMNKYVRPNKEKMAQGAARVEERAARELGIQAEYGERELEQRGEIAVEDLEKSLDNWISYLSDANEPYPVWFRYYVFRNILELTDYDKDKKEFSKRSAGTTKLFPEKDSGALAYVEDRIEASKDPTKLERLRRAQEVAQTPAELLITRQKAEQFAKLPFAKQYAEGIQQSGEITPEMKKETRGKWVKYQQGTDPTALWASLQNKGTAWCTKGFATAETQLKGGDFYVYYTLDKQGKPAIPRVAIRMQGDQVGEVRGVSDSQQNVEPNMLEIAQEKYHPLPGGDVYDKKSGDVKKLSELEKKTQSGQQLVREDLIFLYELEAPIDSFGYGKHPKIQELRSKRNPIADMPVVFDCEAKQIATSPQEINENTKAFVGPLFPGIFKALSHVEHVYTSFPEGKIKKFSVEIGGRTEEQLEADLEKSKINVSEYARHMMKQKEFTTENKPEQADLVRLKVRDIFSNLESHTTDEIYKKAEELGLELCPAEVGPRLRLDYKDQPLGEWFYIAMKQINDPDGGPGVFRLARSTDGLWLGDLWASPRSAWGPDDELVFRFRK